MFSQTIATIIDQTISDVGSAEYQRLSQLSSPIHKAAAIEYAFDQLAKLQESKMPAYQTENSRLDQWLSLFYLLWYQPRQIYLSYMTFSHILKHLPVCKQFIVLDYGSGAFAVQYGLMIAISETEAVGDHLKHVEMKNYDSSTAMLTIGSSCWNRFVQNVRNRRATRDLSAVVQTGRVTVGSITNLSKTTIDWTYGPTVMTCLTAFHTAYDENKERVGRDIEFICHKFKPRVSILTSHSSNKGLISEIKPTGFNDFGMDDIVGSSTIPYDADGLTEVTKLRRGIRDDLIRIGRSSDRTVNYLNGTVTWSQRDAYAFLSLPLKDS